MVASRKDPIASLLRLGACLLLLAAAAAGRSGRLLGRPVLPLVAALHHVHARPVVRGLALDTLRRQRRPVDRLLRHRPPLLLAGPAGPGVMAG